MTAKLAEPTKDLGRNGFDLSVRPCSLNDSSHDTLALAGPEPPSGFILKLYQMVNGAPDEVITVSHTMCRSCFIVCMMMPVLWLGIPCCVRLLLCLLNTIGATEQLWISSTLTEHLFFEVLTRVSDDRYPNGPANSGFGRRLSKHCTFLCPKSVAQSIQFDHFTRTIGIQKSSFVFVLSFSLFSPNLLAYRWRDEKDHSTYCVRMPLFDCCVFV